MSSELSRAGSPSAPPDEGDIELTVVMPCLNEAETLQVCIEKAWHSIESNGIAGEVVIADNGSTDGSQAIAEQCGARVVPVSARGYGAALQGGIAAARGRYVIMADADDSYDFSNLMPFVEKLREGYELVMGNRFQGGIAPGAMPPLHYYLGNPVLSGIGRLFFHSPSGDFHCGLRGFRKSSCEALNLQTTGMEFASEMVVKATLIGQKMTEVPTTLSPDGRSRPPHLRSWRDGWRHLRFLLLYSPRWLFLLPGVAAIALGVLLGMMIIFGPPRLGGIELGVNSLVYAAAAVFVGFQSVLFSVFTKVYGVNEGLLPPDPRLERLFRWVTLETGVVFGLVLILAGIFGTVSAVRGWSTQAFGPLDPQQSLLLVVPAVVALTLGFQAVLSSFFLSVLGLGRKRG